MDRIMLNIPGTDEPVAVQLEFRGSQLTIQCQNETINETIQARVISRKSGEGMFEIDGQIVPYYTAQNNGTIQVWVQGQVYEVEKATTGARRASSGGGGGSSSGDMKATMPGKVLKVNVSVGDNVEESQTVIIMESMKMEMSLNAPFKGTVNEILVKDGDMVEIDTLLARLEPESTDG